MFELHAINALEFVWFRLDSNFSGLRVIESNLRLRNDIPTRIEEKTILLCDFNKLQEV